MAKYVQKGKAVWLSKAPAPTGVAITAVTKAKPAVLTVVNTAVAGDIVRVEGTGFAELDGRVFVVSSATGTSITLANSNTVASTGTLVTATAKAYHYEFEADFSETCFSSFNVTREPAATIAAATFCSTDSLAGQAGGTTVEFGGFDDPESEGLKELLRAFDDGLPRVMVYCYPASAASDGVTIYKTLFPSVTISGLSGPSATPDGAATFTGTAVVNGKATMTFMS